MEMKINFLRWAWKPSRLQWHLLNIAGQVISSREKSSKHVLPCGGSRADEGGTCWSSLLPQVTEMLD